MVPKLVSRLVQLTLVYWVVSASGGAMFAQGISTEPSILSDQKAGSILFYNKFTSSAAAPWVQDTQINITNTNGNAAVTVHLFFLDGRTCTPADFFITLTPNQTTYLLASEVDPGIEGYIIAVASSGVFGGLPIQFNFLIGDAYIREADGRQANLAAVAVAKRAPGPVLDNGDGTANLVFDAGGGTNSYDRLPRVVAVSSFNSQTTDSTKLAIYTPVANLLTGSTFSPNIFTLVFDDAEHALSTSFRVDCYDQVPLSSLRVAGTLNGVVPQGRTGWIRMYETSGRPLLGAVLNKGPKFNGGHNLHHLTLTPSYTITVPVF